MIIGPWPDHLLSIDEWIALPEDNSRHYELVEGVLVVGPRPPTGHQRALGALCFQLDRQLPAELVVVAAVEMVLNADWPAFVRVPDLSVVSRAFADTSPDRFHASDVLLAVEVIWPGTRTTDRVTKMFEYAQAGIPNYWLLDIDHPVTLAACRLVDGQYQIVGQGSETLVLSEPAPVTVDVAGLLPHRA